MRSDSAQWRRAWRTTPSSKRCGPGLRGSAGIPHCPADDGRRGRGLLPPRGAGPVRRAAVQGVRGVARHRHPGVGLLARQRRGPQEPLGAVAAERQRPLCLLRRGDALDRRGETEVGSDLSRARTTASARPPSRSVKKRSILIPSTGTSTRWVRSDQPVPKSSNQMAYPSSRNRASCSEPRARSTRPERLGELEIDTLGRDAVSGHAGVHSRPASVRRRGGGAEKLTLTRRWGGAPASAPGRQRPGRGP